MTERPARLKQHDTKEMKLNQNAKLCNFFLILTLKAKTYRINRNQTTLFMILCFLKKGTNQKFGTGVIYEH